MKTPALLLALAATLHAAPPEPKFRAVTIDDKIQIGYGVAVADVDGDKLPDILLADKKQFVWYRNPGAEKSGDPSSWTKYLLAENLTEHDNVCLAAQDIDGDGKCEIAVGAEWNPGDTVNSGAVFYLIPPADRTQKWEPVKFPNVEPTTHRMKWIEVPTDLGEPYWGLVVVPLHGRGNKNGEGVPVKVLLYHKPADVRGEWKGEIINESMHMTHNFDQMHDDFLAFCLGGKEGVSLIFYVKDKWVSHLEEFGQTGGIGELREGKIGGGHPIIAAIEPMHGNRLVINFPVTKKLTGNDVNEHGTSRTVTDQLIDGHALACGDLLGVGSDQIVVGWRAMGKPEAKVGIHLWTPFDPEGKDWRDSAVDDGGMACEDLVLADLNGDGKLDIIASGRATHNVKIYFNETAR